MVDEEQAAAQATEHGGLLGYSTGIPVTTSGGDACGASTITSSAAIPAPQDPRCIVMALSAARDGARVMFVTLEMPKAAIAQRMVSYLANVNTRKLLHGLTAEERDAKTAPSLS